MKGIKLFVMYFAVALIFFQCQDPDLVAPRQIVVEELVAGTTYQTGAVYYVSTTGNDANNGTSSSPWRTLKYAVSRVAANSGATIKLAAGTYVENGRIDLPPGVNIEGAGREQTILKAASSLYYNPTNPQYAADKFLINLNSASFTTGRQVLKNFTIDGDGKRLHGGIYVRYRNNVNIENVKIQYTNFTAIWLWDTKDSALSYVWTLNCSWASSGWQSGAINIGNLERVEFANLDVNEGIGYGVKAIGPSGYNNSFKQFIVRDSRFSVHPQGTWNGGSAPNIAFEMILSTFSGCQIYNSYFDNTLSLVNPNGPAATGTTGLRIYNNTFDLDTRAHGQGYGIELSIHDVEIDHNYFFKGTQAIANWDNPVRNWNIHHNIFYGIQSGYPADILRSQRSGLQNVKFYNNTIELTNNKTVNIVGVYGGTSNNVDIKNNLIINSCTSYSYYPSQLVRQEGGAGINGLQVGSNLLKNMTTGGIVGNLLNNLLGIDPKIACSGVRPTPYYIPSSGSPLIDGGVNVGLPFAGSRPDIGAYETGLSAPTPPASNPTTHPTTPTTPPSTPPTTSTEISIDASQAILSGKMAMGSDPAAGHYFVVPTGSGTNWSVPTTTKASFTFQAPSAGNYTLWVKVKAANSDSRGFYIYDGKGRYTMWFPGIRSTWTWVKVAESSNGVVPNFSLQAGTNTVQFCHLHENVQVDKMVFTTNPNFTPTN